MPQPPAGSLRDTPDLARRYSETSQWQRQRGRLLIDLAQPRAGERVLDLGCGTGELSCELARRVGPLGRVDAIDPAPARLEQARAARPAGLDQLVFAQGAAGDLARFDDESFDLVYSNYAVHWVLDQPAMLSEIRRILRPGGRFVSEFLSEPIPLFAELIELMPNGGDIAGENCFLGEAAWREMVAERRLDIERFERPEIPLRYADLSGLFDWLEATSHGAFEAARIAPAARRQLESRFPGEIVCLCKAFRLSLRRAP
jgi:SAM-dependent methyltransferase